MRERTVCAVPRLWPRSATASAVNHPEVFRIWTAASLVLFIVPPLLSFATPHLRERELKRPISGAGVETERHRLPATGQDLAALQDRVAVVDPRRDGVVRPPRGPERAVGARALGVQPRQLRLPPRPARQRPAVLVRRRGCRRLGRGEHGGEVLRGGPVRAAAGRRGAGG